MKRRTNKYLRAVESEFGAPVQSSIRVLLDGYRRSGEDIEAVAERLGVRDIVLVPMPFDGGLFACPSGGFVIRINSLSPRVRRRFTLAHEIGHLVMADRYRGRRECARGTDLEEACNALAAEILMPVEEFSCAVLAAGEPSPAKLRDLARRFDVSLQSAARRVHDDLRAWRCGFGMWEFSADESSRGWPASAGDPREKWFVGKRSWRTRRPPFVALHKALGAPSCVRVRESYFDGGTLRPIELTALALGRGRVLGMVA